MSSALIEYPADWALGLDVGSDSIGWAVFQVAHDAVRWEPCALIDGGVRLFDGGRNEKSHESLAGGRGKARRARRRLKARVWRCAQLRALLAELGLCPDLNRAALAWALRAQAVAPDADPLPAADLAIVLLHLARHRGFKSLKLGNQTPKQADKERIDDENRWQAAQKSLEQAMHKWNSFPARIKSND